MFLLLHNDLEVFSSNGQIFYLSKILEGCQISNSIELALTDDTIKVFAKIDENIFLLVKEDIILFGLQSFNTLIRVRHIEVKLPNFKAIIQTPVYAELVITRKDFANVMKRMIDFNESLTVSTVIKDNLMKFLLFNTKDKVVGEESLPCLYTGETLQKTFSLKIGSIVNKFNDRVIKFYVHDTVIRVVEEFRQVISTLYAR